MTVHQVRLDRTVRVSEEGRGAVVKACTAGNGRSRFGAAGRQIPEEIFSRCMNEAGKIVWIGTGRHSVLVAWEFWETGIWIATELLTLVPKANRDSNVNPRPRSNRADRSSLLLPAGQHDGPVPDAEVLEATPGEPEASGGGPAGGEAARPAPPVVRGPEGLPSAEDVDSGPDSGSPKGPVIRRWAASLYCVHRDKVLMIKHRKLGTWLPPGGKMKDVGLELPPDAALREMLEETGLVCRIVGPSPGFTGHARSFIPPQFMDVHDISPTEEHVVFVYFGVLNPWGQRSWPEPKISEREISDYKWCSEYDLTRLTPSHESVIYYGCQALNSPFTRPRL